MLQDIADIVQRCGKYLGDSKNTWATQDYLLPFIDQQYDIMDVQLERLGMQYVEGEAVFDIPANTSNLSSYQTGSGPLSTMKFPKHIDWKIQGQPDVEYQPSEFVDRLDDVDVGSIGLLEWKYTGGAVSVTPSTTICTARIYFDQISTNILDPDQNVVLGTAHILAARVARDVAFIRGNKQLADYLKAQAKASWMDFGVLLTMNNQKKQRAPQPLHNRRGPTGVNVPAPST